MLDVKLWLNSNAAGAKFTSPIWKKAPAYPYGVYDDSVTWNGADTNNAIGVCHHTLEIYLFTESAADSTEQALEMLFIAKHFDYEKEPKQWIESENHFETYYKVSFVEKGVRNV